MTFSAMRIARPVTVLERSSKMYCRGLGLQQIGSFADHDGFSGVMLGKAGIAWHLEFTLCHEHPLLPAPSAEDLLVLYFPEKADWESVCTTMLEAGFSECHSFNPYWDAYGRTFVDEDSYRTVIQCQRWP